jgi:hypothetical protein
LIAAKTMPAAASRAEGGGFDSDSTKGANATLNLSGRRRDQKQEPQSGA